MARPRAPAGTTSLRPLHARFVAEFLIDRNATQAAIRAGYSQHTAAQQGSRLLSNANIRAEIAAGEARRAERTEVTQDRVIHELAKLGFCNMQDYIFIQRDGSVVTDLARVTRDQAAAIAELTTEVFLDTEGAEPRRVKRTKLKLVDKITPLVKLGQHVGMFPSRHEITGRDGGPIEHAAIRAASTSELLRRMAELLEKAAGTAASGAS